MAKGISLNLKETLLFRDELLEKLDYHRQQKNIISEQVGAINKLLESSGIINFTSFCPSKKFNPIIDTSKNIFFK